MDYDSVFIQLRPRTPTPPPAIRLPANYAASPTITPQKRKRGPNRKQSKSSRKEGSQTPNSVDLSDEFTSPLRLFNSDDRVDSTLSHAGPAASLHSKEEEHDSYQCFIEATLAGECAFYQLSERLFIVNGWNFGRQMATNAWYHLDRLVMHTREDIVVCMCPAGRDGEICFHKRFMIDFGAEHFRSNRPATVPALDDQVFLFLRYLGSDEMTYVNLFSVPAPRFPTIKNRAVVEYTGADDGSGAWRCNRDPKATDCPHVISARHSLQQHLQRDMAARDAAVGAAEMQYLGKSVIATGNKSESSVSHLPIPPPIWARIKTDPPAPTIRRLLQAPSLIPFDPITSSCSCRQYPSRVASNQAVEIQVRPCVIYGLTGAWESKIEVQRCPQCRYRFVGPDCREIGLFNWNNRVLLTHQLLEDYLNTLSASETPITAYVTVMKRRYQSEGNIPFLSHQRFGAVFFSYAKLLQLDGDMVCPRCGPNPDALIFDGVSLSFDQKNIQDSLKAPSVTDPTHSPVRDKTKRVRHQQFIRDRLLRKDIRRVIVGPSLVSFESGSLASRDQEPSQVSRVDDSTDCTSSEEENLPSERKTFLKQEARNKRHQELLSRFKLIPGVVSRLREVNIHLGDLFDSCFGTSTVLQGKKVSKAYHDLFIQISAEESALQMMNRSALQDLYQFLMNPNKANCSRLIGIPALYQVSREEFSDIGKLSQQTLGVCTWLYTRAELVRELLVVHSTAPSNPALAEAKDDWTQDVSMGSLGFDIDRLILFYAKIKVVTKDEKRKADVGNILPNTVPGS